jgi:hypothetical protein
MVTGMLVNRSEDPGGKSYPIEVIQAFAQLVVQKNMWLMEGFRLQIFDGIQQV